MAKSLCYCLLFVALCARADDDVSSGSKDALKTARKDLESLSLLEREVSANRRTPESKPQIPSLMPVVPSTATSAEDSTPDLELKKSRGWLLDALEKNDRTSSGRFRGPQSRSPNEALNEQRTVAAPNPLNRYLDQWLSPPDRRQLAIGRQSPSGQERGDPTLTDPLRLKIGPTAQSTFSNSASAGALGLQTNPYLAPDDNSREPPRSWTNSIAAPGPARGQTPPALPLLPVPAPYSDRRDMNPKSEEPRTEQSLPPPTAPLLDENRYFPQLRRF